MRTLQTLSIASILLAVASTAAAQSQLCDIIKRCERGCYASNSRVIDVEATSSPALLATCGDLENTVDDEYVSFQLPLNWAPTPAILDCAGASGVLGCEGWPQGESITYSWSASSGFSSSGGTSANSFRNFSCIHGTTGTITVTAYSPQGAASSASTAVTCP